jgi:hypothetical protein
MLKRLSKTLLMVSSCIMLSCNLGSKEQNLRGVRGKRFYLDVVETERVNNIKIGNGGLLLKKDMTFEVTNDSMQYSNLTGTWDLCCFNSDYGNYVFRVEGLEEWVSDLPEFYVKVDGKMIKLVFGLKNVLKNDHQKDSISDGKDSLGNKFSDAMLPKDFVDLKTVFSKDSVGRMDSTREIPLTLLKHFLKEAIIYSSINSVNPVVLVENRYGYFYMVKMNCAAGGDCAEYYLLAFDKKGKFIESKELGVITAEEDNIDLFKYKVTSDTTLITWQVDNDLEKDKVTKSKEKRVRLSFAEGH